VIHDHQIGAGLRATKCELVELPRPKERRRIGARAFLQQPQNDRRPSRSSELCELLERLLGVAALGAPEDQTDESRAL
jgi:hypothetical protein